MGSWSSETRGDLSSAGSETWPGARRDHPYPVPMGLDGEATVPQQATRRQVWATALVAGTVGLVTLALLPFAGRIGPAMPGFVPAYQTAVCLFYAMSFMLLVNHFRRTRQVALLHVGALCLFSAGILLLHMLSFPIWGATQLIGTGPATTSWLWTFWHLGPAVLTMSYVAALGGSTPLATSVPAARIRSAVTLTVLVTAGLIALATAVSTWGVPYLPMIVKGDDYSALVTSGVGPAVLALTLVAVGLLSWRTRGGSTLDLCLALALVLLICDDLLTLAGGSRLSLGWYAGRAEAAGSAAILLVFYLLEIDRRFARVSADAQAMAEDREVLNDLVVQQRKQNASLMALSREDGLTGLANRRRFDEVLATEWHRARRDGRPLSLLIIDVDHFKRYNDRYGHLAGDDALCAVADAMRDVTRRPADLCARHGGEEFAILLPDNDASQAVTVADALVAHLAARGLVHEASEFGVVTASIGVACYMPPAKGAQPYDLIATADLALYSAKSAGRNRVVAFDRLDARS